MKYVLLYRSGDLSKAAEHFPAHRARWADFQARGLLLMIGPFAEPGEFGAMAIFTTREAAEDFAGTDPFVLHGVVSHASVLPWREAIAPDPTRSA